MQRLCLGLIEWIISRALRSMKRFLFKFGRRRRRRRPRQGNRRKPDSSQSRREGVDEHALFSVWKGSNEEDDDDDPKMEDGTIFVIDRVAITRTPTNNLFVS